MTTARDKLKLRMQHCRQIAEFLANNIMECRPINCNDVSTYLYKEIKFQGEEFFKNVINEDKTTIELIMKLDGYERFIKSKTEAITINDHITRRAREQMKTVKIPVKEKIPRSTETEQLNMAFWFIDQIGDENKAVLILDAAIKARQIIRNNGS